MAFNRSNLRTQSTLVCPVLLGLFLFQPIVPTATENSSQAVLHRVIKVDRPVPQPAQSDPNNSAQVQKFSDHVFANGTADLRHPIHLSGGDFRFDRLDAGFLFRLLVVMSGFGLLMLFFVMLKSFGNKPEYGYVPNKAYDSEILAMFDDLPDEEDDLTVFDAGQYKRLSSSVPLIQN